MLGKIEVPKWISPPRPGALKCTYVGDDKSSIEFPVQFKVNGHTYTSFVPPEAVDLDNESILIHIIGSLEDGSYLIDLPSDTLTSGTRLTIHKDDPQLLIYDPV